MTVKELKAAIADLPDDMIVASYDVGGYPAWEFCSADVITDNDPPDRYPEPKRPFLSITAA